MVERIEGGYTLEKTKIRRQKIEETRNEMETKFNEDFRHTRMEAEDLLDFTSSGCPHNS